MSNIILIGFMGSGKTTVGKILSSQLKFNFIDTDEIIENKENLSIPEIFNLFGEFYFRKLENSILTELKNLDNCIISTGGGFPVYIKKINILKSLGLIFYLHSTPNILLKRIGQDSNRPLIKNFFNLYRERLPYYRKIADHIIDTSFHSPSEIANRIREIYENSCG